MASHGRRLAFTSTNLPVCRSNGGFFIDPSTHVDIGEYPCRTTVALKSDGWEVVETCKRLSHIANKSASPGARGALTILSTDWFEIEEHGMLRISGLFELHVRILMCRHLVAKQNCLTGSFHIVMNNSYLLLRRSRPVLVCHWFPVSRG